MELLPMDETRSAFEDYSITTCNLPDEILEHIFAFLEVEDRKSVRLVCRLWYHCSTCSPIAKKEKFVLQKQSSIEDITKVMLKSHFSILNLDFWGFPDRLPIGIWKGCGNQIHSLTLTDCELDDEIIENVIVHCVNLKSLTLMTSDCWYYTRKNISCSPLLLNMIIEKGIQRPKLHTFRVFICHPSIEIIVNKIFHVCPCIRHFNTRIISPNLISPLPISLKSLRFTQALSLTYTKDKELIKKVPEWIMIEALIAKAKQGLRLERFSGIFAALGISSTKETLLNFFSLQKNLIAIKIKIDLRGGIFCGDLHNSRIFIDIHTKEIFFHILKSCPSLQEIRFESYDSFLTFKWEECPQFFSSISKLQSLHLGLFVYIDGQHLSSESHLPSVLTPSKNLVLTTLELKFSAVKYSKEQDQLCAALFQHCPLLLHLKLWNSSDYTLSVIFKYLLKLQTLILWYDKNYNFGNNYYGFTSHDDSTAEGYSIKQLQQLKHFGISSPNWDNLKPLTERIMLEIQLPHLEFLELNVEFLWSLEEESMNRLSSPVPKLKFLTLVIGKQFYFLEEELCKILKFCSYMKNLHCMHIDKSKGKDSSIVEDIFRACPNIKYVTNNSYVWSSDPITRKIQCKMNVCNFRFKTKVYDIFPQTITSDWWFA